MLIRTAEPARYVERMLAAHEQRRRQRRVTESESKIAAPARLLQTPEPPPAGHWLASSGKQVPAAHVRRIRAGYVPAQGAA